MNSINNGWNSTKRAETLIFIVVAQVRTKMREKGKQQKKTTKKQKKQQQQQQHENE